MESITTSLSTTNPEFGEIEVEITITAPGSLDEAIEWFGGEEKTLGVLQGEVKRRKVNAARPVLREAEQELDWTNVAQQAAEAYEPGRRGGFSASVSADEVAEAQASGDVDELLALLASKGVNVTS